MDRARLKKCKRFNVFNRPMNENFEKAASQRNMLFCSWQITKSLRCRVEAAPFCTIKMPPPQFMFGVSILLTLDTPDRWLRTSETLCNTFGIVSARISDKCSQKMQPGLRIHRENSLVFTWYGLYDRIRSFRNYWHVQLSFKTVGFSARKPNIRKAYWWFIRREINALIS